jgi:hypothetical protein
MRVDQRDLGGLGVVAEQLDVDIGQPRRGAVPDRAADVGAELPQALHPFQRQQPQLPQFARLGVGAEQLDVVAHLGFDLVVVGQRGARAQPHLAQGATFRGPVFEPLLDHEPGRDGGDFALGRVHASILPRMAAGAGSDPWARP